MDSRNWFLVATDILHMKELKENEQTWWCVDKRSVHGDKAFLYKRLEGVLCYFEIIEMIDSQPFCDAYGMTTAKIKALSPQYP